MKLDLVGMSEWGPFDLIPSEGWKVGMGFKDFGSGLLVIHEYPIDPATHIPLEFGTYQLPYREYIIDIAEKRILEEEEWRQGFHYGKVEYLIPDTPFRVIQERKRKMKTTDIIEEVLINTNSGEIIRKRERVAFYHKAVPSIYDEYVLRLQAQEKKREEEAKKLTLESFFFQQLHQLRENEHTLLCQYQNKEEEVVRLLYKNGLFQFQISTNTFIEPSEIPNLTFQDTVSFEQLNEAWTYLTREKDWYKLYEPLGVKPTEYFASGVLGPYIVRLANLIRYDLKNRWGDYSAIRRWEISFDLSSVSREEMMQFCPHCYRQVTFLPRYPAYLCENCLILLTDEKGRKVTYHQVSAAGGCQGFFRDTNEMYDSTVCFIQGESFVAEEGKYGGIFVQPDFVH